VYLVAVIDWYSRKVLSWRLSNTLDSGFCGQTVWSRRGRHLEHQRYSTPIRAASLQARLLTFVLKAHGIAISMDGRGRALDFI